MSGLLIRGLVLAAVLGVLTAGYFGWRAEQRSIGAAAQKVIDQREVDKIKAEAALALAAAVKGKDTAEAALRAATAAQEEKDVANQKTIATLGRQLSALGVLRDPYAKASGCGSGSSGPATAVAAAPRPGASDVTETTGLLSKELTGFLRQQADEADAINAAYISCRADLLGLKGG